MKAQEQKYNKVFEKTMKNKQIHESVLLIENFSGDFSYHLVYGGKKLDTPILMTSITKLFTTTCILILKEQGKLSLEDKLSKYFEKDVLSSLHTYKGQEYSKDITLSHLLSHTSGLPDAIGEGSNKAKKRILSKDRQNNFDDTIMKTKQLKAHFAPNIRKRAHYANINFDILGKVIEKTLEDVFKQFIFDPLGLKNTYLPKEDDFIPNVYYKENSFYRPKMIRGIQASGGGVSTAPELMIFIKAFFTGKLFNKNVFQKMKVNNRLQLPMYPIHYGAGFMRIPLKGLATSFMGKGELIGHSGSTGSFAFYYPERDLFFVGDVNQMANPALPLRLVMRLAMSVK